MKTFSAYWTEKLGEAINEASRESYPMEFHVGSEDFQAISKAINQGIDSHLQAVHFKQELGEHGRTRIILEASGVSVLVRRLMESGDENAESLASSICQTLDIELI